MARTAALVELPPADRRRSLCASNAEGHDASLNDNASMEQILWNMKTTPQEEVLQRIASPPDIRRTKVLDIRQQLAEGTYEVADRLDKVIDRVLEAITA